MILLVEKIPLIILQWLIQNVSNVFLCIKKRFIYKGVYTYYVEVVWRVRQIFYMWN